MLHYGTWIPVLTAMLLTALAKNKRWVPEHLMLIAEGDEDIKIADPSSRKKQGEDLAEQAAKDFLRQRELGNIDRARALGRAYADRLWGQAQELLMADDDVMTQQEKHHRLLLCSYLINKAIGDCSPNSIIAQTALNTFYTAVEERSEILHRHVSDTATFSLYILNERTGGGERQVGEIFAKQCGRENDDATIETGDRIYSEELEQYRQMAQEAGYHVE